MSWQDAKHQFREQFYHHFAVVRLVKVVGMILLVTVLCVGRLIMRLGKRLLRALSQWRHKHEFRPASCAGQPAKHCIKCCETRVLTEAEFYALFGKDWKTLHEGLSFGEAYVKED